MKCCLVHYLKGVRAYQRRIRELKEQVELWEDRAAYEKAGKAGLQARAQNWQTNSRRWRSEAEDARDLISAAQMTAEGLREEIARLQGVIAELKERDREEKGGAM